ncbi:TPA: hypothetical protein HA344_06370 [Candidatus Bathyarchaeota archaeon]|nr:hypothetical protein [Candidatus Bathyarchaeota archaeon]
MSKVRQRRFAQRFTENISTLRSALETVDEAPGGSIHWTDLVKKMCSVNPSMWQINTMICYLRREHYLRRPERGVYTMSKRGAALLEALNDPAHREASM